MRRRKRNNDEKQRQVVCLSVAPLCRDPWNEQTDLLSLSETSMSGVSCPLTVLSACAIERWVPFMKIL